MTSSYLILWYPLLLLPSIFHSIRVFTNEFFASGGQNIGASASASVLPMNIQGWFPLGLTGLTQDHGCTSTPKSSSAIQEGALGGPQRRLHPPTEALNKTKYQTECYSISVLYLINECSEPLPQYLMKLFHMTHTILGRLLKTLIHTIICYDLETKINSKLCATCLLFSQLLMIINDLG